MNAIDIALPLEKQLSQELFDRLEGSLIEEILQEAKVEHIEDEWKMLLEGHSYRISESRALSDHSGTKIWRMADFRNLWIHFEDKMTQILCFSYSVFFAPAIQNA